MKNKLQIVPFTDTPEQHAELDAIIADFKNVPGALVQVLKRVQEVYGYLPLEVQQMVADGLDLPLEEIYGVVSFYSLFSIQPKGEYRVAVCLGTACYVKGAQEVFDKCAELLGIENGSITKDGKFSLDATRCIGCCGLAPVLTVNDDVYGKLTADDVADILKKYN